MDEQREIEIRKFANDIYQTLPPNDWGESIILILDTLADNAYEDTRWTDFTMAAKTAKDKLDSFFNG